MNRILNSGFSHLYYDRTTNGFFFPEDDSVKRTEERCFYCWRRNYECSQLTSQSLLISRVDRKISDFRLFFLQSKYMRSFCVEMWCFSRHEDDKWQILPMQKSTTSVKTWSRYVQKWIEILPRSVPGRWFCSITLRNSWSSTRRITSSRLGTLCDYEHCVHCELRCPYWGRGRLVIIIIIILYE